MLLSPIVFTYLQTKITEQGYPREKSRDVPSKNTLTNNIVQYNMNENIDSCGKFQGSQRSPEK